MLQNIMQHYSIFMNQ